MLQIIVPGEEGWDESKEEFIATSKETKLCLEHSLISLSKWESKWCKPFFSTEEKTAEETIDYVKCMTLTRDVDPAVYYRLSDENVSQINDYIEAPMTATTFAKDSGGRHNREKITSEVIYDWMISLNIPFECQKWHINRLLTLIKVRSIKSQPPKKMSQREILSQYAELNAQRRKQLNTKG
jgi:hypothetical protein